MASTGSQTTWSSNGGFYLKIVWDITSQSITNNTSSVRVRMYLGAKSGWSLSDSSNSWTMSYDGGSYSGSNASFSLSGSEELFATYTRTVDHNSDGTKSLSFNGSISGLYFGGINPSSFTGYLDTIPRASSSTSSASWTATEPLSIGITRASSSFTHTVRAYVGATLVGTNTGVTTSTTFDSSSFHTAVVKALNENSSASTSYQIDTFSGSTKIGSTYTRTGTVTAPSASTLGSVPNSFNVGSTLNTFSISRYSSDLSHKVEMIHNGTVVLTANVNKSSASVSLGSTSGLYSRMTTTNSNTVDFKITTYYSDTRTSDTQIRKPVIYKSTALITNADPSNPTMSYTISGYTGITGNTTNVIVQNKTSVSVSFTASTPQYSASISKYVISANGTSDKTYTSAGNYSIGVLNTSGNGTISVRAYDSRDNIGSVSTPITVIAYQPPKLSPTIKRDDGFGEASTLLIKGTMSFVSVSGARKNYIKSSRYRIRELPAPFTDNWTTLSAGTNGDVYTYDTVNGFSRSIPLTLSSTKSYEIEVEVTDAFDSIVTTSSSKNIVLSTGQPLFWLDTDRLSVGVNKFPDTDASFEVGLKWANAKFYSEQSVSSNNEFRLDMITNQDPTGGIRIFSRQDSSGIWDFKDGRTIFRYTSNGGNSATSAYDKGDVILDPFGKVQISSNAEALRLRGTDHEYISFYNGSTRQGYIGQGSASSNEITLTAEQGNALIRSTVDSVVLSAPNGVSSPTGYISGSIEHTSGYMKIRRFGSTYGDGQAEMWYSGNDRKLIIHSRNSGDTSAVPIEVYASMFKTEEIRSNSTANDLIIGVSSSKEVKVMQSGASSTYRPIRASSFPTGSSINYKTNLELVGDKINALDLIKETEIWHYHLKSNIDGGIFDKPKVGVIAEMVNPLIRDEDGIDTYSMISLAWKAIQQLEEKILIQEKEIEDLKMALEVTLADEIIN